jgi:tetratricopeptide (TPR) repeat protein
MSSLRDLERAVADARARGDGAALTEALLQHANGLVGVGQVADAQRDLDEAAALERARGRPYDEARATHLSATLARLQGRFDDARVRAHRALELAGGGNPVAVAAYTELGETALAQRDFHAAAASYARAIEEGDRAGLVDTAKAALLRKRAIALANAQRYREAADQSAAAHELLSRAGDAAGALRALIEQAGALQYLHEFDDAARVRDGARALAEASGDRHALADLHLLEAADGVEHGDVEGAMESAVAARDAALAAVAPMSYVSAALTIAQLAEARGDRAGAYAALASGWVTLGDLLGRDVARATFAPRLEDLRSRWGVEAFTQVKAAYEARRADA